MLKKDCPECRWVAVTDVSGRRRLEMRWYSPAATQSPITRAA